MRFDWNLEPVDGGASIIAPTDIIYLREPRTYISIDRSGTMSDLTQYTPCASSTILQTIGSRTRKLCEPDSGFTVACALRAWPLFVLLVGSFLLT